MGLNNYNSRGDNKRLKTRGLLSSPGTSYIHPPDSWVAREKEESPKKDSFHVLLVAGASLVAQGCKKKKKKKNLPAMQEMWNQSLGREDLLEKEMATHSSILAWRPHGQRSLAGCSPVGWKALDYTLKQLSTNSRTGKKLRK